jgi:hypothetical protein
MRHQSPQRKGQAALEFLTTYGWAFIIILTAIGALAYFGVLKIEPPDRCSVGAEFVCHDFQIQKTATDAIATMVLSNAKDFQIDITGGSCTFPNDAVSGAPLVVLFTPYQGGDRTNTPGDWEPGEKRYVECRIVGNNGGLVVGDKGKVRIMLSYINVDINGFQHTIDGEIVGTAR